MSASRGSSHSTVGWSSNTLISIGRGLSISNLLTQNKSRFTGITVVNVTVVAGVTVGDAAVRSGGGNASLSSRVSTTGWG